MAEANPRPRSMRTRRLEAGLTQEQLAALARVATSTVRAIEQGAPVTETSRQAVDRALLVREREQVRRA